MGEPTLPSLGRDLSVAVIGASGGIGGAFVDRLANNPAVSRVYAFSRRPLEARAPSVRTGHIDILDEPSISEAAEGIKAEAGTLNLVIVATGILHDDQSGLQPEKSWRHLSEENLVAAYRINTVGPALVAKHFLPLMDRSGKSVFAALSARVGSIGDNRLGGWHAYRASKAGLNQILRNCAIELARKAPDALVIGLHPGTVDTGLSEPFQSGVPEGKLFTPDFAASSMLAVIDGLSAGDSGHCFAWDGEKIPF